MFDQPFVRDSFIRQIDPRMRVLLAVLLAVALALLQQVTACCLALGLGCVLLGLARAPLRPLWRRLAAVNMFILFLWLVTPWTTPGTVVWQWHFIQVSREGLYLSLLVTLKSNAIACVFLSLVAPCPPRRWAMPWSVWAVPTNLSSCSCSPAAISICWPRNGRIW